MHFLSFIHSLVFVFRNKQKLVALLVYCPFRRVATSIFRRITVFISSGRQFTQVEFKLGVKTDSVRIQYCITAQNNCWNNSDVTRLLATEHVRIFTPEFFHALLQWHFSNQLTASI